MQSMISLGRNLSFTEESTKQLLATLLQFEPDTITSMSNDALIRWHAIINSEGANMKAPHSHTTKHYCSMSELLFLDEVANLPNDLWLEIYFIRLQSHIAVYPWQYGDVSCVDLAVLKLSIGN